MQAPTPGTSARRREFCPDPPVCPANKAELRNFTEELKLVDGLIHLTLTKDGNIPLNWVLKPFSKVSRGFLVAGNN